ncbi:MAG: gfo/Idh/MocA family oxidoreductase [Candidatus Electrothrix sp. AX2]|nr:gfo/Idh/MocA family oxidoreductase [Candidatus Electrothrix gigas]
MKIAIIGCGYVFDVYMATWHRHPNLEILGVTDIDRSRVEVVTHFYRLAAYSCNEEVYADKRVELVVNLTSIDSHYEVTKFALSAGKHVYSEKPLATSMDQVNDLIALAEQKGLRLSCAPSNVLSDTIQTMWKAVLDGAVGDVRIIYAEFDDNPIYLMEPEGWTNRTGAPWPYKHEYESGCTYEHVAYHLTWLCAMFGPVKSVTAFSKQTIPDKTNSQLDPADTPDFSVACLLFQSGMVARVTCSIAVPYNHRMQIVGNKGMIWADTYRHYRCPVFLEKFTKVTMNARKAYSVRVNTFLQRLLGVNGRRVKLLKLIPPGANTVRSENSRWWHSGDLFRRILKYQVGQQDKAIGIAELVDALENERIPFPSHDFTRHICELTIAIQGAGTHSGTIQIKSSFKPIKPLPATMEATVNYDSSGYKVLDNLLGRIVDRLHKH